MYSLAGDEPTLLDTQQVSRRQIDQVGVLPEAKQLVVLTGKPEETTLELIPAPQTRP